MFTAELNTEIHKTPVGTPYLTNPGVVGLSKPDIYPSGLYPFLNDYDPEFTDYLNEHGMPENPGTELSMIAGQLCYLSFGPKRTHQAEAQRYFTNILTEGHGSILEHANYTFLLYGVSRSLTHELVRHRAGFAYSQVSQRYVGGKHLRFVERPEFQEDETLHDLFVNRIDALAREYERLQDLMSKRLEPSVVDQTLTARRKAVRQAARACLPNETEAPILVTANLRAWRHFLTMRGGMAAEPEIRRVAMRLFALLKTYEPAVFQDMEQEETSDGYGAISVIYRKV